MVKGLLHIDQIGICKGYVYGKQVKRSFPIGSAWRAFAPLELIHAELCGPMQTESLGGSQFFLMFTDDYTCMSWVYFLKYKSQAFENFMKFKAFVEKQSG